MKILNFILLFSIVLISGCRESPKITKPVNEDARFQQLSEEFIKGYLDWRPNLAVNLGFHEYDGKTTDLSKTSIDQELTRLKSYEQKISAIDSASLSPDMNYDLRILLAGIRDDIFNFEDISIYKNNPIVYCDPSGLFFTSVTVDADIYLNRNFKPVEERLRSIIEVEKKAGEIMAAARLNLADSLPKPFVEIAIATSNGIADFLNTALPNALKRVNNDSLMTVFRIINKNAIDEFRKYATYLQTEKLPKANDHFAIGRENYTKMLLYDDYISMSPEQILQIGMNELKKEQDSFNAAAHIINPGMKPAEVYDALEKEHPSAENLVSSARQHTEAIYNFLVDKDVVTIPSPVRVIIKEMPEYLQSAEAMNDTPGPFEKVATEAYYYITPVNPQWTKKQKEDWLRLFNYYTTDITTIHEAYPGHYIQFLHLNASNATKIEKIFSSEEYVEGWAHYTEQMMIDEGFGNQANPVAAAKYRLAQSGDALLRLCRLCVSIKMHCEGMSVDEATKFFMNNWYQGEKPSRVEALRGTYDPRYLGYTLGKLQILKLREDYRKQEGADFSLKKFHDRLLDKGMPPIRLLREIMLKDKHMYGDIL